MSTHVPKSAEALTRDTLTALFERGSKPRASWRLGTEYEKFVVDRATGMPVPYEGAHGIRALLEYLAAEHGWTPYREAGLLVALQRGGESISLEPGGQLELSGAPLRTLAETEAEFDRHCAELAGFCALHPVDTLWVGVHPSAELDHVDWMPKPRYGIMRRYLPERGALATSMMKLTCTVQCNIDYDSERDAFRKFRLGMALTPVMSALFANSPRTGGNDSGYKSWRQHIWTAVDPDRCGQLELAYAPGEGEGFFAAYARWAARVPMFFAHRDDAYVDLAGIPFEAFAFDGAVSGMGPTTVSDWELHLSTLFPDVRLKQYLEVRAADCVPAPFAMAVPALCKGLLYDDDALEQAWEQVADLGFADQVRARDEAARLGLDAPGPRGASTLRPLAEALVELAEAGLRRQGDSPATAAHEAALLAPLRALLNSPHASVGDLLGDPRPASAQPPQAAARG